MEIFNNLLNNKKGQGLSLTVIIVAAIALIVLVVLVAIFLGRITGFDETTTAAGNAQLIQHKISYGDCHPTAIAEESFTSAYAAADTAEDAQGKEDSTKEFKSKISECKTNADEANCNSFSGCEWE